MIKRGGLVPLLFFVFSLAVSAQTAEQLFQAGRGAFEDELFFLAAKNFRSLSEQFPDHALADDAVYLQGVADFYLGNYSSTIAVFRRFETRHRGSPFVSKISYWVGASQFHLGRYEQADRVLSDQIDRHPDEPFTGHAQMLKATALEKLQRWREARQTYDQVVESGSGASFYPEALFRSAAVSLRFKEYQLALSKFRKVLLEYPESLLVSEAFFFSAECLYALDRLDRADQSYQQVLENNPETKHRESGLFRLSQINTRLNRTDQALYWIEMLEREFAGGVYRHELPRMKADLLFDLKRYTESAVLYQKALPLASSPEERETLAYNLGLAQYLSGDKSEAVEALGLAAAGSSDTARRSLFQLGISQMELRRDAEAVRAFEAYLERYPGTEEVEEALRLLGAIYDRSGLSQQSLDTFSQLILFYPESDHIDEYLFRRGSSALTGGDANTALKDFFRLYREYAGTEHWIQSTYNIGYIYSQRGEFMRALPYFDEAAQAGNNDLAQRALLAGGTCLFNAGEYTGAARRFAELTVSFGPWSGEGWFYLGRTQYRLEQLEEAAESFRKASRILQGTEVGAESLYWRGLSYFRLDRLQPALQVFVDLTEDYPQGLRLAEAHYRAGLCAVRLGLQEQGIEFFEKAESRGRLPDRLRADVLYQKGFALYALQQTDNAVKVFNTVFQDFPGSPLAQEAFYKLAEAEYEQDRFDNALEWFSRSQEIAPETSTGRSALYWAGASAVGLNRDRKALEHYLDYLLLAGEGPLDQPAVEEIRRILAASTDQRLVRRFYSEVLENPQAPSALKLQVRFEHARREFDQDIDQAYQELMELRAEALPNPLQSEVDFMIGRVALERRELGRAEEIFQGIAAGQAGSMGARAQLKVAEIQELLGEPRLAAEEFLKVYFIYPDERLPAAEGLFKAASLYQQIGDSDNAANLFAKLKAEFPESSWIE